MTPLAGWQNFYVIVGSSAGALIGLQFVVLSLIADSQVRSDPQAGHAFATPTIVHFWTVLMLSALLSAPWQSIASVAIVWGVIGTAGVIYVVVVVRRMRAQTAYRPVLEDWVFHVFLPLASYVTLAVSAYLTQRSVHAALFGVAIAALLLLFVGIHNAWDAVTWHVFTRRK